MKLWRIASTGATWRPDDMTGAGAAKWPGRWNMEDQFVIYAAPTIALAVLETAAHIDDSGLPLNKYIIEIEIPDDVWASRLSFTERGLDMGWDAIPHGVISLTIGSNWYTENNHAILEIPSCIVPEESVVLINAIHPDTAKITASTLRRYDYNSLFRPKPKK